MDSPQKERREDFSKETMSSSVCEIAEEVEEDQEEEEDNSVLRLRRLIHSERQNKAKTSVIDLRDDVSGSCSESSEGKELVDHRISRRKQLYLKKTLPVISSSVSITPVVDANDLQKRRKLATSSSLSVTVINPLNETQRKPMAQIQWLVPRQMSAMGIPAPPVELLMQEKQTYLPSYSFVQIMGDVYRLKRSIVAIPHNVQECVNTLPKNVIPNGMTEESHVVTSPLPEKLEIFSTGKSLEGAGPSSLVLINPTVVASRPPLLSQKAPLLTPSMSRVSTSTHRNGEQPVIIDYKNLFTTDRGINNQRKNGGKGEKTKSAKEQEKEDERDLICRICGRQSADRFKWYSHKYYHKRNLEKNFKCKHCERTFVYRYQRDKHEKIHEEDKKFQCSICQLKLRTKLSLENHVQAKHSEGQPGFECSICQKAFHVELHMKMHMRLHNRPRESHICEYCGKKFSYKLGLNRHIWMLHKPESVPQKYLKNKCPQCNHVASSARNLVNHIRLHTGEKPFECPECQNTFRTKSNLQKHLLVHSQDKPYQCNQCEKSFKHLSNLKFHEDRYHLKTPRHQCKKCDRKFYAYANMLKHFRRAHIGIKSHSCTECSSSFFEKQELRNHLKTHGIFEQPKAGHVKGVDNRSLDRFEPDIILNEDSEEDGMRDGKEPACDHLSHGTSRGDQSLVASNCLPPQPQPTDHFQPHPPVPLQQPLWAHHQSHNIPQLISEILNGE